MPFWSFVKVTLWKISLCAEQFKMSFAPFVFAIGFSHPVWGSALGLPFSFPHSEFCPVVFAQVYHRLDWTARGNSVILICFDVEELSHIWLFASTGGCCLLFFQATHVSLPLQVSHKLPQTKEITQKVQILLSVGGISVWFASPVLCLSEEVPLGTKSN